MRCVCTMRAWEVVEMGIISLQTARDLAKLFALPVIIIMSLSASVINRCA